MKRCLILITTAYPCNPGEPYLEAEIPILAERFEKILLLPIGLAPNAKVSVPLPENVVVRNCATMSPKKGKISDLIHGVRALFSRPKVPAKDLQEVRHSPIKRLFLGYFLARSQRHTKELLPILEEENLSGYDEVVLYSYWFFVAAAVAGQLRTALADKFKISRFVSRVHSYDLYTYANRLHYLPCRAMLLQMVDGVYACSEDGKQFMQKHNPAFEDKIHCAYLGSSAGVLTEPSSDGQMHILTCARTIPLKRLHRLAESLALLPDNIPVRWTHIGDGPSLPELKALVKKLQLPHVQFTGALPHEDVLRLYQEQPVDLFVNVSSREGLPVSIMEALSFGVPAIATLVGGCGELIEDGQNGFLISPDFTNEDLAQTICKAYTQCKAMRQAAFDTWQNKFSASRNFAEFADLLCGIDKRTEQ